MEKVMSFVEKYEIELEHGGPVLLVKRLTNTAHTPKRATKGSIGYDLYCDERVELAPGIWGIVKTGIAISIPEGCYGRIAPRSSLGLHGIYVVGGVINPDYREELLVTMVNNDQNTVHVIESGIKIAQLILEKANTPPVVVVETLDKTNYKQ